MYNTVFMYYKQNKMILKSMHVEGTNSEKIIPDHNDVLI